MNNTFTNKNLKNEKIEIFDWNIIQTEMKNKLGLDIYESWLKKINFLEEFNNYIRSQFQPDLFEIGLRQDI